MATKAIHTNNARGSGSVLSLIILMNLALVAKRHIIPLVLIGMLVNCADQSSIVSFYRFPRNEWPTRLEQKTIPQQWSIFLYGMNHRHPPPYELAIVLAQGREITIDQIILTLERSNRASDMDGISATLETMETVQHYDPCSYSRFRDEFVQSELVSKVTDGIRYRCSPV